MMDGLKVLSYELEFDTDAMRSITLDRVYGIGIERWAIRLGDQQALCKTTDQDGFYSFHIESLPSSRDDDYYEQYRWLSAEDAILFWQRNRHIIAATGLERRARYNRRYRSETVS